VKELKGIYVLIIQVSPAISCCIGALGELTFQQGLYAYVGSAQNNIELRVKRHQRKEKRLFWHIDYLLNNEAKIIEVFYKEGGKKEECKIAKLLGANGLSIYRFGSSDCRCNSHLYRVSGFNFLEKSFQRLNLI
jgi:Uri superfamily endonuclease